MSVGSTSLKRSQESFDFPENKLYMIIPNKDKKSGKPSPVNRKSPKLIMKRDREDTEFHKEKFYKTIQIGDKQFGTFSSVNQTGAQLLPQKCLKMPINGILCSVPISDIFESKERVEGYFSLLVESQMKTCFDKPIEADLNRAEKVIVQLSEKHFGPEFKTKLSDITDHFQSLYPICVFPEDGKWKIYKHKDLFADEQLVRKAIRLLKEFISDKCTNETSRTRATNMRNHIKEVYNVQIDERLRKQKLELDMLRLENGILSLKF